MTEKPRVCHVTGFDRFFEGGIKTSVRQQRKALEKEGVEYTQNPRDEYEILHVNYPDPWSLLNFFIAELRSKKTVIHSHVTGEDFKDSMRFSNLIAPLIDKYCYFFYKRADLVIAPSEYTKNLHRSKGMDNRVEVVSNGIDTDRLEEKGRSREELREEFNIENFVAANLGMLFERKGLSDFIETGRRKKEMDFCWFGPKLNGVLSSRKTKKKIKNSPENVRFPGFIDEITEAFELADAFFFPTKEENQGISLLEAAYKEMPIVVRDIPTFEGWLKHEENCLKADDVEGFVEQLERLEENEELREKLGGNARSMAKNHTLDNIGEELKKIYNSI